MYGRVPWIVRALELLEVVQRDPASSTQPRPWTLTGCSDPQMEGFGLGSQTGFEGSRGCERSVWVQHHSYSLYSLLPIRSLAECF